MQTTQIINIVAIIIIPIVAVLIGHYLQVRSKKRDDKMYIFKALMTTRVQSDLNRVNALNIIDIVFADSREVRNCWKEYHESLRPTNHSSKVSYQAECKLLEAIAKNLGYKNMVTWDKIQNPYYPVWLDEARSKQEKLQNDYGVFVNVATQAFSQKPSESTLIESEKKEGNLNNPESNGA